MGNLFSKKSDGVRGHERFSANSAGLAPSRGAHRKTSCEGNCVPSTQDAGYVMMDVYLCDKCNFDGFERGLCKHCADNCHKGHLVALKTRTMFLCDCQCGCGAKASIKHAAGHVGAGCPPAVGFGARSDKRVCET
eukprot:RCo012392